MKELSEAHSPPSESSLRDRETLPKKEQIPGWYVCSTCRIMLENRRGTLWPEEVISRAILFCILCP